MRWLRGDFLMKIPLPLMGVVHTRPFCARGYLWHKTRALHWGLEERIQSLLRACANSLSCLQMGMALSWGICWVCWGSRSQDRSGAEGCSPQMHWDRKCCFPSSVLVWCSLEQLRGSICKGILVFSLSAFFGAFAKCTSPGKRCWFSRFLQTRTVCGTDSFISVIYTTALGAVWSKSTALLVPQGRLKSRRRQNTGACHSREGWGSSTGSQMGEKELCFLSEQNLSSSIIFLHASLLYMRMGCSRCPCWAAAFQPAGCTLLCCSRRAAGPHAQLTAGRDCCPLLLLGYVFVTDSLISAASGTWCISGTYRSISSLLAQTFLLLLNNA